MNSYGMDNSDRGFCDVCNWALNGCICSKRRECSNCGYTVVSAAEEFLKHSCIEHSFQRERDLSDQLAEALRVAKQVPYWFNREDEVSKGLDAALAQHAAARQK